MFLENSYNIAIAAAVQKPLFRVKPYAHPLYKFVVRGKVEGAWKRHYFRTEAEANAFAQQQNREARKSYSPPRAARLPAPSAHGGRTAVVILGMHRSGTSAVAGLLSQLGIDFGEHLMPPGYDNELGYWEHLDIVQLHDRLLESLGRSWDDERALPSDWLEREETRNIQSSLKAIVERDFAGRRFFGLKDPRLCRLLPLWLPLFEDLVIEPVFILAVRHPWEVAQSLLRRNWMPPARSYLLWLRHTLEAERYSRGSRRSVVQYEELLRAPEATLKHLTTALDLAWGPAASVERASSFLQPSLRHHTAAAAAADESEIPRLVLQVYGSMLRLDEASAQTLDRLHETLDDAANLFAPLIAELTESADHQPAATKAGERDTGAELLETRWNLLDLRAELLRRDEASGHALSRIAELEERERNATTVRDHLREVVQALLQDLEQERLNLEAVRQQLETWQARALTAEQELGQARELSHTAPTAETVAAAQQRAYASEDHCRVLEERLRAAEQRVKATAAELHDTRQQWELTQSHLNLSGKELAALRKQMVQLRERWSGRLILPFGRSQQRFHHAITSARRHD